MPVASLDAGTWWFRLSRLRSSGTGFLFPRIVPWPRDPIQVPGRQFYRFFGVIAGVRCFMRGVDISMLHAAE
jgi:hypothetical protein